MTRFENYITEAERLLTYKEYNQLTKRLIDLALDTQSVKHYKDVLDHLDWLDYSRNPSVEETEERYTNLFLSLKHTLMQKAPAEDSHSQTLIAINNLVKQYGSGFFRLGPINLELKENQMLGLVGENGNGKTTLLRVLAKELEQTSGRIEYNFNYTDDYDLRSRLVYIPQRTPVWQGSLMDNLQFTAAMYGTTGEENQMKVELVIARMGIRKYRGFAWSGLSSGYKMRFELARALLRNPRVMLIDEPLANLDILAQKNVLDDLRGIASSPFRPMGVMLSSQQLYEVEKNSDDVLFLKEGSQKNLITKTTQQPTDEVIENAHEMPTPIAEELLEPYIVEFETPWDMPTVRKELEELGYTSIQINGGTFICKLPPTASHETFLRHVLKIKMPLTYFRDISKSTRRFFLS